MIQEFCLLSFQRFTWYNWASQERVMEEVQIAKHHRSEQLDLTLGVSAQWLKSSNLRCEYGIVTYDVCVNLVKVVRCIPVRSQDLLRYRLCSENEGEKRKPTKTYRWRIDGVMMHAAALQRSWMSEWIFFHNKKNPYSELLRRAIEGRRSLSQRMYRWRDFSKIITIISNESV